MDLNQVIEGLEERIKDLNEENVEL